MKKGLVYMYFQLVLFQSLSHAITEESKQAGNLLLIVIFNYQMKV